MLKPIHIDRDSKTNHYLRHLRRELDVFFEQPCRPGKNFFVIASIDPKTSHYVQLNGRATVSVSKCIVGTNFHMMFDKALLRYLDPSHQNQLRIVFLSRQDKETSGLLYLPSHDVYRHAPSILLGRGCQDVDINKADRKLMLEMLPLFCNGCHGQLLPDKTKQDMALALSMATEMYLTSSPGRNMLITTDAINSQRLTTRSLNLSANDVRFIRHFQRPILQYTLSKTCPTFLERIVISHLA